MVKQTYKNIAAAIVLACSLCITSIFAQTLGTSAVACHTIVTTADGIVYAWGQNTYGQLGDNSTNDSYVPVAVYMDGILSGKTIIQVAAGYDHSIALDSDGTVYTWGANDYGQLGNNSTDASLIPVAVYTDGALNGKTITQVAAGKYFSAALASDGTVYTWGQNTYGQLGNNSTDSYSSVPVAVNTGGVLSEKTITQIAVGMYHVMALSSDGAAYSWGFNSFGQLGNNSSSNESVPVAVNTDDVLSEKTITEVAAGGYHSAVLASDGTVYTWGRANHGELGNNSTTYSEVPVAVNMEEGTSALYGKTVIQIVTGYYHCIALASDSTVYTWGYNSFGELGNNSTTNSSVPVAVNTEEGTSALYGKSVAQVAAGQYHSIALSSDGTLSAWGYAGYGQLGNSGGSQKQVPVEVNQDDMGILPVELSSFTGTYTGIEVELAWETSTEVNNYGFNVERKAGSDGSWVTLEFIEGLGAENAGYSYTYTDNTLPSVDTVSYRLKQIDNDATYQYSKTVEVVINSSVTGVDESDLPTEFGLEQNYPNPFNPTTTIAYQVPSSSNVTLKVYDLLGREVATLVNGTKAAGSYSIEFDASKLASGIYIYRMQAGDYVSVKKLMLMK